MFKKLKSTISACLCGAIALTLPSMVSTTNSVTASAASSVTLNLTTDNAYVTADSLKSKDMTVHLKLYVEPTSQTEKFETSQVVFTYDSENMYLRNISSPTTANSTSQDYTYSFGSFSTKYTPFCFGNVTEKNGKTGYSVASSMVQTTKVAYDSKFGSVLYADGQGGFYFTVGKYKDTKDGTSYTKTFATNPDALGLSDTSSVGKIDMVTNDDGSMKFRFTYVDQETFNENTKESSLVYYDTNLAKNTVIPGNSDKFVWTTTKAASVLGTTDEVPFIEVDAVLKKGTTAGTYTVSLDSSSTSITSESKTQYSKSNGNLNISSVTINVIDSITVTDYKTVEHFYTNESDTIIKASDFVKSVTANIVVGGAVQKTDITDGISCNKTNVSDLYKKGYEYTGVKVPLIYSGVNLFDKNGEMICAEIKIGLRGDANLDGEIDSKDAVVILKYYANYLVNSSAKITSNSSNENFAYFLADVTDGSQDHGATGGKVDSADAVAVLRYYAQSLVGSNVSWSDIV